MGVSAGRLYMYVVVVQKFMHAISSPDELLFLNHNLHITLLYVGLLRLRFVNVLINGSRCTPIARFSGAAEHGRRFHSSPYRSSLFHEFHGREPPSVTEASLSQDHACGTVCRLL